MVKIQKGTLDEVAIKSIIKGLLTFLPGWQRIRRKGVLERIQQDTATPYGFATGSSRRSAALFLCPRPSLNWDQEIPSGRG